MTVSFEFHDVTAGYGANRILKGVSGELLPGAVTALIGPNGSGKSTLLKTLAGFLSYGGSIALDGHELKSYSRKELGARIGIVAQNPDAKAAFTVYDVIAMGRLPHQSLLAPPSPEDDAAVESAAAQTELTKMLFRPVTELSGGERQRVFLAMLVAQDAPVCLLDEPTSAMDPRQALHAFRLMRSLAGLGKTVAVVAHDVNAALFCADRCIALRGGRVIASGRADEIDAAVLEALYDTPFTAYRSQKGDTVWHAFARN